MKKITPKVLFTSMLLVVITLQLKAATQAPVNIDAFFTAWDNQIKAQIKSIDDLVNEKTGKITELINKGEIADKAPDGRIYSIANNNIPGYLNKMLMPISASNISTFINVKNKVKDCSSFEELVNWIDLFIKASPIRVTSTEY